MQFIKRVTLYTKSKLANIDALPQLTLLGMAVGILAGSLIVIFRLLVESTLSATLPGHNENFEGLPRLFHFLLPFVGSIIIGLGLHKLSKKYRDVGVGNVLERFHNYQGRMPAVNLFVQFIAGTLSLISGQSVGREGPAVHLGASSASLLGQWLKLPNSSLRILVGCGTASAIAASFDTPLAGVIFAMEVVIMSYSIVSFIPIIMASVCGAIITRLTFGESTFFTANELQMHGLMELPLMIVTGFVIGVLATLYMRLQLYSSRFNHFPILWRMIFAGFVTGLIALIAPEILGLGYDTVNLAMQGKITISVLFIILIAKILATGISIGVGMPGGLIGPQLFTGACIGAIIGSLANVFFPESVSNSGFYVLLGMAAMMGAVINAPLAALMAVLELTYNPSVLFPSMLIIVISCVTTRQIFKCEGIFIEQLAANGKSLAFNPAQQILSNIGVRYAMQTAFTQCNTLITIDSARQQLQKNPLWIVISHHKNERTLLRAADLAAYLGSISQNSHECHIEESIDNKSVTMVDLLEIPAQRFNLSPISDLATLYKAQQTLKCTQSDGLFVTPDHFALNENTETIYTPRIIGIITQATIENHYKL